MEWVSVTDLEGGARQVTAGGYDGLGNGVGDFRFVIDQDSKANPIIGWVDYPGRAEMVFAGSVSDLKTLLRTVSPSQIFSDNRWTAV
jgi:hypothetical protein